MALWIADCSISSRFPWIPAMSPKRFISDFLILSIILLIIALFRFLLIVAFDLFDVNFDMIVTVLFLMSVTGLKFDWLYESVGILLLTSTFYESWFESVGERRPFGSFSSSSLILSFENVSLYFFWFFFRCIGWTFYFDFSLSAWSSFISSSILVSTFLRVRILSALSCCL